jgi:hypothetical protein
MLFYQHKWNYVYMCTMKPQHILKGRNALVKSVYYAAECTTYSTVSVRRASHCKKVRHPHAYRPTCTWQSDTHHIFQVWSSLSSVAQNSSVTACYAMSLGSTFQGFKGPYSLHLHGRGVWEETFEISSTTCPVTHHHIPENVNFQSHQYYNWNNL